MSDDRYIDTEGRECSLDVMVKREPEWAANRLRVELTEKARLTARVAYLERVATELETCFCADPALGDAPDCATCKMWEAMRPPRAKVGGSK